MSTTHDAGTVTPLLTMPGSVLVDIGDFMPTVVAGQQRALDVLDARNTTNTRRITAVPSGDVRSP